MFVISSDVSLQGPICTSIWSSCDADHKNNSEAGAMECDNKNRRQFEAQICRMFTWNPKERAINQRSTRHVSQGRIRKRGSRLKLCVAVEFMSWRECIRRLEELSRLIYVSWLEDKKRSTLQLRTTAPHQWNLMSST